MGQLAWAQVHVMRYIQERRRARQEGSKKDGGSTQEDDDEPQGVGIGVRSTGIVTMSVALVTVIARSAYFEPDQRLQPLGLAESFADARQVREVERRVEIQQQAIEALQAEVNALQQELERR
jgi:hypothetical protein